MSDSPSVQRTIRIASLAGAAVLSASTLAGCGQQTVHETAYCTTQDGTVVDDSHCDENSGGAGVFPYYIWITSGGTHYRAGQVIPTGTGHHFLYNDTKSRTTYGLPKTGKISSGTGKIGVTTTRTISKSGGFGFSGSGHSSGGSHGGS